MAMVGVTAYRQLLRKMRTAGAAAPTEDSAAALQQVSAGAPRQCRRCLCILPLLSNNG